MNDSKKLISLYSHQESSITNRTNLMLVAQSFLIVGFVGATSSVLQLLLAGLGIYITLLTVYVSGREYEFFIMVRDKLKLVEPIFKEIDVHLKKKRRFAFLGRASEVLCFHLQYVFLGFWLLCLIYAVGTIVLGPEVSEPEATNNLNS